MLYLTWLDSELFKAGPIPFTGPVPSLSAQEACREAWAAQESWSHSGMDQTTGPSTQEARRKQRLRERLVIPRGSTAVVKRMDIFPCRCLLGKSYTTTSRNDLPCSGDELGVSVNASVLTSGRHQPTHVA